MLTDSKTGLSLVSTTIIQKLDMFKAVKAEDVTHAHARTHTHTNIRIFRGGLVNRHTNVCDLSLIHI